MSDSPRWTRRGFLEAVGRAGGAAAVYETMVAMGMIRVPEAFAGPPQIGCPPRKEIVAILGAGIAGLTAAYELSKAGYEVRIIEAKARPGGRSYTVRKDDTITENTGTTQTCRFDAGNDFYLNAGPGRLPYHHTAILYYCKLFNVPLEVYTMMTRANYYQRDGSSWGERPPNSPMPNRRIANDTRGWISELLAKSVLNHDLDEELSKRGVDKCQFLDLLTVFGDLDPGDDHRYLDDKCDKFPYAYTGSSRSGYVVQPGIESCGTLVEPLKLADLVSSQFWRHRFYQAEEYEWQPTLFQPVGGMDKIWSDGFMKHLAGVDLLYNETVSRLENVTRDGKPMVRVVLGKNQDTSLYVDWCISTIPLPILATIDNNFNQSYKDAVAKVKFDPTVKVGWQANSRFWEKNDEMYGGISYTTDPITQIWYPSWAYFSEKGILTGAYNYDDGPGQENATNFGKMTPEERLKAAWKGLKKVHPNVTEAEVPLDRGISIAWQNVPFQLGGWAKDWGCGDNEIPQILLDPEPAGKRFWVAGDQVSYISGWQEGAVRSACHVLEGIAGKDCTCEWRKGEKVVGVGARESIRKAPGVRRRTRGLP